VCREGSERAPLQDFIDALQCAFPPHLFSALLGALLFERGISFEDCRAKLVHRRLQTLHVVIPLGTLTCSANFASPARDQFPDNPDWAAAARCGVLWVCGVRYSRCDFISPYSTNIFSLWVVRAKRL
jgi:hypothetical protein